MEFEGAGDGPKHTKEVKEEKKGEGGTGSTGTVISSGCDSEEEFHDCKEEDSNNLNLDKVKITEKEEQSQDKEKEVDAVLKDAETGEDSFEEVEKEVGDALLDDFVDEDFLKESEAVLTEDQLEERLNQAKELKEAGNKEYQEEKLEDSIKSYTNALLLCPLREKDLRAVLYGNRGAAKIKYGAKENAVMDCNKALEYKEDYMKVLIRRAKLYEEMDKLDEALTDYKKIYELDPGNKEAFIATQRLPPIINERNEKLKEEMMGKLKDLGNMVLRPFGLSTSNFQLQQTDSGGYTVNFKQ